MGKINRRSILELSHNEAREFFLKDSSYCNFSLPPYFSFENLLKELSKELNGKIFNSFKNNISDLENVNYTIYANKDGNLSWRPLQLINPAVYVCLVHEITEEKNWEQPQKRFFKFQNNPKINCISIPVESLNSQSDIAQQILQWWEMLEQQSIILSMECSNVIHTDIADCYNSIYTHAIAWAIEGKNTSKNNRKRKNLGNSIDFMIRSAQYEQTNGIPQGSVLMDFIAEIILGYIDRILSIRIKKEQILEYQILRYRDDYRIFTKKSEDRKTILKLITEIFQPFGFKLNASKTKLFNDIITNAIKEDKLAWLECEKSITGLSVQKQLMIFRQHSMKFKNSGSVVSGLNRFNSRITEELYKSEIVSFHSFRTEQKIKVKQNGFIRDKNAKQIISIITDIGVHNPRAIPVCCSIISRILPLLNSTDKKQISELVCNKFSSVPNSGFAQIWLQRMNKSDLSIFRSNEPLCGHVTGDNKDIWNNSWLKAKNIQKIFKNTPIFKQEIFTQLSDILADDEVNDFVY